MKDSAQKLIADAFEIGQCIVEAGSGFHFAVATEGGHVFTGCPDSYTGDGFLTIGESTLIDLARIVAVTVIDIATESAQ